MKQAFLDVLVGLLLGFGLVSVGAQTPLTPALSLSVNTDQNGYLVAALGAYTAPLGPLTSFSTIRLRTDSAGSLLITFPTGADGTVPTGVVTGKVLASAGVGLQGVWSASPTLTSVFLGNGSQSAPSVAFTGATNSGVFTNGADVLITRLGTQVAGTNGAGIFYANIFDVGGGGDVLLNRDAANTLAQRNGTNGQAFNVYNTYTDASNYERINLRWTTNTALLTTSSAGTGSARDLNIGTQGVAAVNILIANSSAWRFDSSGNLLDLGAHILQGGGAIKSTSATAGVGYATGAGGAVTQGTSRTTGVTLNTVAGDITLFSAAGSATAASFTVTNSAVAVTDNIIPNQKSGTDLYEIFITNVAAGSFKVTFFTTGGTTVEQPVFHFSVIKSVSS